jgi:hypothetical protein
VFSDQPKTEDQDQDQQQDEQQDDQARTEKPEVKDEHKEQAKDMRKEYDEGRPTVILPGTGGTVTGTAVNEWLDDDGNPKFGSESESEGGKSGGDDSDRGESNDDKSRAERVEEDKKTNAEIIKAHDEEVNDQAEDESDTKDESDSKDESDTKDAQKA